MLGHEAWGSQQLFLPERSPYILVPVQSPSSNMGYKPPLYHSSYRFKSQRYYGPRSASLYKVAVKVGDREFYGEGLTAQVARHDAAGRATDQLRNLPLEPAVANSNLATNDSP